MSMRHPHGELPIVLVGNYLESLWRTTQSSHGELPRVLMENYTESSWGTTQSPREELPRVLLGNYLEVSRRTTQSPCGDLPTQNPRGELPRVLLKFSWKTNQRTWSVRKCLPVFANLISPLMSEAEPYGEVHTSCISPIGLPHKELHYNSVQSIHVLFFCVPRAGFTVPHRTTQEHHATCRFTQDNQHPMDLMPLLFLSVFVQTT